MDNILEQLKEIDCSPTKKYTKWLLKQYKNETFDISFMKSYVEEYDLFSSRNMINGDIYSFKNLNDFIDEVDYLNNVKTSTRKELQNDYDVVLDHKIITIYRPNSHEASRKLGLSIFNKRYNESSKKYDCSWCTTYANNSHWDNYYYDQEITFYYCKINDNAVLSEINNLYNNKFDLSIFACAVNDINNIHIYDANDKSIDKDINTLLFKLNIIDIIKSYGIILRKEKKYKYTLKLLNSVEINSDLAITPKSLKDFDIKVNCKKINGNLYITGGFKTIPSFLKNIEINGSVIIKHNQLSDLENTPQKIAKDLYCCENELLSLKGCPSIINDNFLASRNNLKSLTYAPEMIGGYFDCSNNKIENTNGLPKHIGESIYLQNNKISTLIGFPKTVNGNLSLQNNKLKDLIGVPNIITEDFTCYRNELITLSGVSIVVGGEFDCSNNNLEKIDCAHDFSCNHFNCANNNIKSIKGCPSKINILNCSYNKIYSLQYTPKNLESLFCNNNYFLNLVGCPDNLKIISCSDNSLISLKGLPKKIKYLYCKSSNWITNKNIIDLTNLDGCRLKLKLERNKLYDTSNINFEIEEYFTTKYEPSFIKRSIYYGRFVEY